MDFEAYFHRVYENYDRYAVIPAVLWIAAFVVLGYGYFSTASSPYVQLDENRSLQFASSDMMDKGIEFAGGTEIRTPIEKDISVLEVERKFADNGYDADARTGETSDGDRLLLVTVKDKIEREGAMDLFQELGIEPAGDQIGVNTVSAAVSAAFFQQAALAVVFAFTIMSLVIFMAFKDITPSIAVIFAAAGDIMISLAAMYIIGIPLTLASVAALLMLIGYSVDTDIVLSTRVLKKRRGSLEERIWSSIKTGITMSLGGIAGFSILYIASHLLIGASSTFSQIAAVMVVGLLADIPLTWFGNAYILKRYEEEDWQIPSIDFSRVKLWN